MPSITLNQTEITNLKTDFLSHYSVSEEDTALQNDLEFSWTDFKDSVLGALDPDETIIRFTHRYDPETTKWYLTAAQYSFDGYTGPGNYSVSGPEDLFDLNADGTITPYEDGLEMDGSNYYDPEYFSNVLYDDEAVELSTNVSSVLISWEELKQLHCDNKNSHPNEALFKIRFCSISPDCTSDPGYASVTFPHTIAAYMIYDGNALLDNSGNVPGAIFRNKAADFGSACPPTCAVYAWPAGLVPKNC
jgi:hypothetical protein